MSRFLTPQLFEFVRDNIFYNEVKKSVLEVGKEFLEYDTQQQPQSAVDKIRAMPKPTLEERQKARAFLDAAKQSKASKSTLGKQSQNNTTTPKSQSENKITKYSDIPQPRVSRVKEILAGGVRKQW